jgi:hypothetical protein
MLIVKSNQRRFSRRFLPVDELWSGMNNNNGEDNHAQAEKIRFLVRRR